ncbi:LytS/YhcK type 5TM receptor domain-containing protein [uncultured Tateyamaria sp.]|uniref:LytS/YhcK type 5TM receptor domain-containing protein n=1 Tax=Tateyamaria sp. 1078 TaxID=3417464 RepID=UPI002615E8C8|nr:LytS/YhcK type 5TM receptor domain-containing protein [uncultured Tateyamaria sp.]
MSFIGIAQLVDFVSSIAVLGLLVIGFSAAGPAFKGGRFGPLLQGLLFGLVVSLQMSMPVSPAEGVIVDMRNVPIVLAGAFLGLRGLMMCLCIAVAVRIGLGGVGVLPGVVGMLIAGAVGYAWSRFAATLISQVWIRLAVLAVAVNLHMLSAFLAPHAILVWYFQAAAPTILVLNLISVPIIGLLLLREQVRDETHARLAASAKLDPATRLLALDGFAHEVSHFNASGHDDGIAGVIAVTLKNTRWLKQTWGSAAVDQTLGALRVRVAGLLQDNRPLGIDAARRLLVPVTEAEMLDLRPMRSTLRRLVADTPFLLDGNVEVPLSVLVENFRLRQPGQPATTAEDVERSASKRRVARRDQSAGNWTHTPNNEPPLPAGLSRATMGRLFDLADAGLRRSA